jgi:hypothetical protein
LKAPKSFLDFDDEYTVYAFTQNPMIWTYKATRLLLTIAESEKVVASTLIGSSHADISASVLRSLS